MKKTVRALALVLALGMLLTVLGGCDLPSESYLMNPTRTTAPKAERTTPASGRDGDAFKLEFSLSGEDILRVDARIDRCRELSFSTTAKRDAVNQAWNDLERQFDFVSDQVIIAEILYYLDTTDETAKQTYLDAADRYMELSDKVCLLQKEMYEDSPVKDWFFAGWSEEDIAMLASYTSEQAEIQAEQTEIGTEFVEMDKENLVDDYTDPFIRMVTLGNKQAQLNGYENYYEYMAALAYGRDYGTQEREKFHTFVKEIIMPVFGDVYDRVLWDWKTMDYSSYVFLTAYLYDDYDDLDINYLNEYIQTTTGSTNDYLNKMFTGGNYIITDDVNALDAAFTVYLAYYDTPLCYFGPSYQDSASVAHELGHYYAEHFVYDTTPLDLLETHSQGNEILLLANMKKYSPEDYDCLRSYLLFDILYSIVIASMVDEYELRIYGMDSVENLTQEDITRIINDVANDYFGAWGGAKYVEENLLDIQGYIRAVTGQYPAYYISYGTSAVTVLNLFALAEQDEEAARELYRKLVEEAPLVEGYEAALLSVGAASPFEESSFHTIVDLFAE